MNFTLRYSLAAALLAAAVTAQTTTALLQSGTTAAKKDIVIVGDGFTAADQATFNTYVTNTVMNQLFNMDVYRDAANAFNIWRVNVNSVNSGVTQVNSSGTVTVARNTALDYRYSGVWSRCWMEPGPNTSTRLANLLATTVPGAEYVFIVLNESGFGGCRRGNTLSVTLSSNANVCAHEMGHMVGNLGDEYTGGSATYTGGEPSAANLTRQTNRALIKWRNYIPSTRPIPTVQANVTDFDSDVGLFEGATLGTSNWRFGLYRPTFNSRMNSNSPEFCPVGYEAFRDSLNGFEVKSFYRSHFGDFNGDSRDDCVIHNANSFQLFLSDGSRMVPTWGNTGSANNSSCVFHVGDFNADGRDDLFRVLPGNRISLIRSNGTSFTTVATYAGSLPGWSFSTGDRFLPTDFDGDGRTDIIIHNTTSWSIPYVGLFRSTGTGLAYVNRYDGSLPGWTMSTGDRAQIGDFDGDNRDDLMVFNGSNWSIPYLAVWRSTGGALSMYSYHAGSLPGWTMAASDQQFVGDFNADGRDDFYVRNGVNWASTWLGMMRSTGAGFAVQATYGGSVPGWSMTPGDRCFVADPNGDGRKDLVVFNTANWATEYLGIFRSSGVALSATWQADWIGSWNLGAVDNIGIANFTGGLPADDVCIFNSGWFGLLRSNSTSFSQVRIYPKYIRNIPFHSLAWW
ncbi:MAG: VCBS repeat-containing protein [Planctomycetes bacterium]|nr:VCBS repeat-containing protein [Planctomycetota bacterium]